MLKKNGYTVMELVVVMFAMSIVTAAIAPLIKVNVDSYMNVTATKFKLQTARICLHKLLTEMRQFNGTADLDNIEDDEIEFFDANGNWVEYIYSEDDEAIGRTNQGYLFSPNHDPLIGGVESFQLTYYDYDGNVTTSISDVHRIKIYMVLKDPDDETKKIYLVDQICINRF